MKVNIGRGEFEIKCTYAPENYNKDDYTKFVFKQVLDNLYVALDSYKILYGYPDFDLRALSSFFHSLEIKFDTF